jgi:septum formation protein
VIAERSVASDLTVCGVPQVVLASASPIRATLLRNAGIPIVAEPAYVDEDDAKRALKAAGAAVTSAAEALAELKAQKLSQRYRSALVIGADQILECDGEWLDKPTDLTRARAQLLALRNRDHHLISAVVVVHDGVCIWHYTDSARLRMRAFSEAFLENYLVLVGTAACASVGGYQLEGLGVQLIEKIDGDFFTILGLPLLPLLHFLRHHSVLRE